ncbi:MAG TPA: polysaccharide biosynthesis/export family protein [Terracidiphilus sp.]|jgi:polysaccharide export outer membrane protein
MKLRLKIDFRCLLLVAGALGLGSMPASAQYMGAAVTSPPATAGVSGSAVHDSYTETKIEPGDVIAIATYGAPELTTTAQTSSGGIVSGSSPASLQGIKVGSSGEISLPYLGPVKLAGLTPTEAAVYLSSALKQGGFLVEPQVSVELVDSPTRAITVIGEVMKPSPIPAFGHIRLLDAISACGGLTSLASHSVTIRRVGDPDPISVELGTDAAVANASDVPLLPGDTVIVSKVGSVFVLGYVKTPAAIPLSNNAPITVLRALAMAGGVNYGAALSKARIIRTTAGNQQVEIRLDLRKIMFGKQQDVALDSNDILLVPGNAFKAGMAAGGAGVAATLIYGATDTAAIFR